MDLYSERKRIKLELRKLFNENKIDDATTLIRRVERSIYNYTLIEAYRLGIPIAPKNEELIEIYSNKFYNIYCNLDSDILGNEYLINELGKSIDSNEIATMGSEDMFPGKNKLIHQKIEERRGQTIKVKTTDMFKCGNCGKRETVYKEVQMRALDEPASLFITCVNCGKEWRKG